MRYAVYKSINLLSDSIVEAVNYTKNNTGATNLLSDCVVAISSLKNIFISNSLNTEKFDMFLECIDKIVECIEKGEEYQQLISVLMDITLDINKVCKGLKYKLEILFLAELGSKWDAMDSVYRALKNRNDCAVNVVIMPIFRAIKLSSGEVKSDIIYEDYLTPMGIENIPFKDYDIKKHLPDITFTSQPYESVMPEQFWAENIVPYTKLVYLPYFTSRGIVTEKEKNVQCELPTQKIAWKVICESEQAKKVYSKFSPSFGENILASGLPKWDWVINMEKRNIEFPKQWNKLKNKKIILKNQHYIFQPRELLELIRSSINYFDKSDFGLLYRFHPLTETMFNVYYPNYFEEWEKVKKEIENSSNVAIDYNTSYDCAFKYSDILLTGYTSLIQQYVLTKKPIVIIHQKVRFEEHKKYDNSENAYIKNTELLAVKTSEEGYELCKKILTTSDYDYDNRMRFINDFMPNADGKIGERIASKLISEFLEL